MKSEAASASGNSELTIKQTTMAFAATLESMKKRSFEFPEIISRLCDKGIEVKPQTLVKYLAEARRLKASRKNESQPPTHMFRAGYGLSPCRKPKHHPECGKLNPNAARSNFQIFPISKGKPTTHQTSDKAMPENRQNNQKSHAF